MSLSDMDKRLNFAPLEIKNLPIKKFTPPNPPVASRNSSPLRAPIDISPRAVNPSRPVVPPKPSASSEPKKGFELVDVRGGKKFKNDAIYRKDFRFKTAQALKGTLKRSEDRWAVADRLWNARGKGGISNNEVRNILGDLEKNGMPKHTIKALRQKFGAYKSGLL